MYPRFGDYYTFPTTSILPLNKINRTLHDFKLINLAGISECISEVVYIFFFFFFFFLFLYLSNTSRSSSTFKDIYILDIQMVIKLLVHLSLYSTATQNTWRRGLHWAMPPTPEFCVGDTNMLVSKM